MQGSRDLTSQEWRLQFSSTFLDNVSKQFQFPRVYVVTDKVKMWYEQLSFWIEFRTGNKMINTKHDPLLTCSHFTPSFTANQISQAAAINVADQQTQLSCLTTTDTEASLTGCTLTERHESTDNSLHSYLRHAASRLLSYKGTLRNASYSTMFALSLYNNNNNNTSSSRQQIVKTDPTAVKIGWATGSRNIGLD